MNESIISWLCFIMILIVAAKSDTGYGWIVLGLILGMLDTIILIADVINTILGT